MRRSGALAASVAAARNAPAKNEAPRKETYTYKRVGETEIKADVYRPDDDVVRPVVLWIHGGALIVGTRDWIDARVRDPLLQAGCVVVSIDYRLAPETKLREIYEDIQDAYAWLRTAGPEKLHIDADRIVVMGASAGGFLTLSAGFLFRPRPRALVSFWGYGDVAGTWYSRPDPFYLTRPRVSKQEAYRDIGKGVVTDSIGKPARGKFYLYCRQNGLWPREVTGHDPDNDPAAFDAFCPLRNVTESYPPTLLIHGDRDTDVPFEQSVLMARELRRKGVKHELIRVAGAGHGLRDGDPVAVDKACRRVTEFVTTHTLSTRNKR